MDDNVLAVVPISEEQGDRYEQACDALTDLLAAYGARREQAAGPAELAEIADRQRSVLLEKQRLRPSDQAAVQRILDEYPALIRALWGELA